MLAGGLPSCKDKEKLEGNVPFKLCPCEEEKPLAATTQLFSQGEAYLFRDSISWDQLDWSDPFRKVCWIVYNSETDETRINFENFALPVHGIRVVGPICNFPDFAKKWDIPANGYKVYFEGKAYAPCNPAGLMNVSYLDYVLTNLQRK